MFYILWNSFYLDMTYMFLWDKTLFERRKQQKEEIKTNIPSLSTFQSRYGGDVHVRVRTCVLRLSRGIPWNPKPEEEKDSKRR